MRAPWLLGCGIVACLGCSSSFESQWLDAQPSSANYQTGNNLKQIGLAAGQLEELIGPPADGKQPRRLVYHAEVDIVVDELTAAEQELEKLVQAHEGIVANAETLSRSNAARAGLRRLRIPVARFDTFLKVLGDLGEVQRNKLDVQDVTRDHSELEEQIRNLTAEATGLRELLKKPSDKLADALAVREQLSKVTRETEGLKARWRRMQDQAEYSTVTLRLLERSAYTALPLSASMSLALRDSWGAFITAGRSAVVYSAMLLPWLPVAVIAGLPLWAWRRRRLRRAAAA
jgi:hypothetical protein